MGLKLLANTTLQAVLLVIILGVYACSLGKDIMTLKRLREKEAIMAHSNTDLLYDQPSGIDVFGKHLVASSFGTKRNVVFLLRNDSLHDDLNFWRHVAALLDTHKEIGLVAYCDGERCVDSIRKMQTLAFPVMAFGEATAIQALVNADSDGNAIVKDVGTQKELKVSWRAAGYSPQMIAQEVVR